MKTAYILGREIADKDELHGSIAQQLDFPDYYGGNLDALYDVLSTSAEPCRIIIMDREDLSRHLGDYFRRFLRVLLDVSLENGAVSFALWDAPEDIPEL